MFQIFSEIKAIGLEQRSLMKAYNLIEQEKLIRR